MSEHNTWQPIETAPKDKIIWLYSEHNEYFVFYGRWCEIRKRWISFENFTESSLPTHWQPYNKPLPPKNTAVNINEWQPIETAPKVPSVVKPDYEVYSPMVLAIAGEKSPAIGGWCSSHNLFYTRDHGFAKFTHWLPLPPIPKQ